MQRNDPGKILWIYIVFAACISTARAEDVLYLEVFINNKNTGQLIEVVRKVNDWEVSSADLRSLGVMLPESLDARVLLSSLRGVSAAYDEVLQQLFISVPGNMLPLQSFSTHAKDIRENSSRRDKGAFVNYNLVAINDQEMGTQTSMWHEVYWFSHSYYLMSNGLVQDGSAKGIDSEYIRFDTFYQKDHESDLRSVTVGDVINATPTWGRSIRIGGIRFARDYELDPNLITYPLPEFYGESAVPGSVDVLINDQLRWRDDVSPGPFLIDTMPHISGAGIADIITTDLQGRQARQSVNFYVASELLSPGMVDYDLTLGFRREDFGLRSDNYTSDPVASGSVRYGVNSFFTPQVLIQAGEGLNLGGLGFTLLASHYGVVELSHVSSDYGDHHGHQNGIGYSYNNKRVGFSSRYLKRSGHYHDLGSIDQGVMRDSQLQLAFSIYGNELGSFNLGYFRMSEPAAGVREFVSFSWSRYFRSGLTLFSTINRQLSGNRDSVFSLTLSMPIGRDGQGSIGSARDVDSNWRSQIQAMRNAPYEGGLGWHAAVDDSSDGNSYASLDWRGDVTETSASVYRNGGRTQVSAEIAGALVVMDNSIYASRTVVDSFALVDAGQAGVPVLIGNQLVGDTDGDGKLLVPDLNSYLENRVAIDPAQLPANVSIDSIEQMVVPRRKGGVHLQFPVRLLQSAIIEVYTVEQQPLPLGSILYAAEGGEEYVVGWNGDVYIEDLSAPLELYWEEGSCMLSVNPPTDTSESLPRLGVVICHQVNEVVE